MKILIADRSDNIRERLKYLVEDVYNNPEIFETESSIEAMSIVNRHRPNLVITDIDLRNGSGLSLLTMLKKLNPKSTKIVFTSHITNDLESVSRKLGADHFLSKANDFIHMKRILTQQNNINPLNNRPN